LCVLSKSSGEIQGQVLAYMVIKLRLHKKIGNFLTFPMDLIFFAQIEHMDREVKPICLHILSPKTPSRF
jgi:hypothetical protein